MSNWSDITPAIETWFAKAARDLPWRAPVGKRDPYAALVAELMLQQTQVSRVIERFAVFMARFPTPKALADAPLDDVLHVWSGLGYYRRARLLHEAAKAIVERHNGVVPSDASMLEALPGVGRYTAGAIASIVFNTPAPIVDGNVARVLLRLEGHDAEPTSTQTQHWLWTKAQDYVNAGATPAHANEGLMELGALICTPRAPACPECPISRHCRAHELGLQEDLPRPKKTPKKKRLTCLVGVVRRANGDVLIEQRPPTGLWAGLWQAPTLEAEGNAEGDTPTPTMFNDHTGLILGDLIETFEHITTHRLVQFHVHAAALTTKTKPSTATWASRKKIRTLALGTPQRRVLLPDAPKADTLTP